MNALDYAVVVAYLVAITAFGSYFARFQKNTKNYFLTDNSIPWWGICFTIVATETSTLTFIGVPASAYAGNWTFLQLAAGYVIGRIVVSVVFLPRYFGGAVPQVARVGVADDRHQQSGLRLRRDAQVHSAMTRDHARGVVEVGVDLRVVGHGEHHRAHDEGQQRELRLVVATVLVQEAPQPFELRHVDFLDVGEVRDLALRFLHLLRDPAAQTDHRDPFGFVAFDAIPFALAPLADLDLRDRLAD